MSVEPGAILADGARREARALPGLHAHRRACPACALGRTVPGARELAELERLAVDWWPESSLAAAASCSPIQWQAHLHFHGLDVLKLDRIEAAAARALALALDGDTNAARVALSAVDRLREARGAGQGGTNGGPAAPEPPADPGAAAWPGEGLA